MVSPKTIISRCPNGKEQMINATIPIKYIGGGAYIIRQPRKQVSLGRGSYMAALEVLKSKFEFNVDLMPAKSVSMYIRNVRF